MSWINKLQARWNARNAFQVVLILVVFACTGLTVVYLMKPVLRYFFGEEVPVWGRAIYYILVLPVYNFVLLLYGVVFGQFPFFWSFEKRFYYRILSIFKKK